MNKTISSKKKLQVRGGELEALLIKALKDWWEEGVKAGCEFKYSQLEFSRRCGVSRETVRKKQFILDEFLLDVAAERRVVGARDNSKALLEKIQRLESDLERMRKECNVLRVQHLDIFKKMIRLGIDRKIFDHS